MRTSEDNPLDLNNLPEDYTTRSDGVHNSWDDSSSSAGGGSGGVVYRSKKKSGGGKEGKDDAGKVYECRFCSLKFCKSQALGGHMNRHRQERETETLNKARQLVFTNDLAPSHLGFVSRSMQHPSRMFPTSAHIPPLQPQAAAPPYMHTSPPHNPLPFPSHEHPSASVPAANNSYYVGHVLPYGASQNDTCIGAPVGGGGFRR